MGREERLGNIKEKPTVIESIKPCLWFDGNGEDAMLFYVSVFKDGEVLSGGRPEGSDPASDEKPMVTNFRIAGQDFMALNGGPAFTQNPSVSYFVQCETAEQVDDLWEKLGQGGLVLMDLGSYPFSKKYGWVQDRFGVSWQLIDCGIPQAINPFLMFTQSQQGRAEAAINFYRSVFKNSTVGPIERFVDGELGKPGTVKYAEFSLVNQAFTAMDAPGDHAFAFSPATSFLVFCDTQAEIDYLWTELSNGGQTSQCGWLADQFGVSWQITPSILGELMGGPDRASSERVMQAVLQMTKLDIAGLKAAAAQP